MNIDFHVPYWPERALHVVFSCYRQPPGFVLDFWIRTEYT